MSSFAAVSKVDIERDKSLASNWIQDFSEETLGLVWVWVHINDGTLSTGLLRDMHAARHPNS